MAEKFRKKPIVIEAMEWTGDNYVELNKFVEGGEPVALPIGEALPGRRLREGDERSLLVVTLEGEMRASVGDWIIKGMKGEFYPCKPDIFEATYEPANQPPPSEKEG